MGRLLVAFGAAALVAACSGRESGAWLGYVEGESVYVAAPIPGQLASLQVQRGQQVAPGAPLFVLEQEREKSAVDESAQRLVQAQAQLDLAQTEYGRQQDLRRKKLTSAQAVDAARTQAETARAQLEQVRAQLAQAQWTLAQKTVAAPAAGVVEDVYYRVGEQVAAGAPVLALLPPQNRKLRFFVPQSDLDRVRIGTRISAHCDGCAAPIDATVRFVAPQAEYTPPVIYSAAARQKLVFLVEAWPEAAAALALRPGQPVEVQPPP